MSIKAKASSEMCLFPNATEDQQIICRLAAISLVACLIIWTISFDEKYVAMFTTGMMSLTLSVAFGILYQFSKSHKNKQFDLIMDAITKKDLAYLNQIPNWQNTKSWNEGITLLSLALSNMRAEEVQFLLTHGADPNVVNRDGSTAMLLLCYQTDQNFVTSASTGLLHAGANIHTYASAWRYRGTPLSIATARKNTILLAQFKKFSLSAHSRIQDKKLPALQRSAHEWNLAEKRVLEKYVLSSQAWVFNDDKIQVLTPSQIDILERDLKILLFPVCTARQQAHISQSIVNMRHGLYIDPYHSSTQADWVAITLGMTFAIVNKIKTLSDLSERMIHIESLKEAFVNCTHATSTELTMLYYQIAFDDGGVRSNEYGTVEAKIARSLTQMRRGIKDESIKIHSYKMDIGWVDTQSRHKYVFCSKIMNDAVFHLPEDPLISKDHNYQLLSQKANEEEISEDFYSKYNVFAVAKWVKDNVVTDFSEWVNKLADNGVEVFEPDMMTIKFSLFIDFLVEMKVIRKKDLT